MIEIPLNQVNLEVGDIRGQNNDGEIVTGKVLRVTTQVAFIIPIEDEAALKIGNALRGINIEVAKTIPGQ